jgi:RecJ-like exonuclease
MNSGIKNFFNLSGKDNNTQKEICVTCKHLGKSTDVCSILPGKSIRCTVCGLPVHRSHRTLFSAEAYVCPSCLDRQTGWNMQRTSSKLTDAEVNKIFGNIFGDDK